MASSLSNLLYNLAERIHKIKLWIYLIVKNKKTCEIKHKDYESYLEYTNVKDNLTEYQCLCCCKNCQKKLDENLKDQFGSTYTFFNHDINNFFCYFEKVLFIGIHRWLGKIQSNIITWERRFLQSPKYGRYYWCRLHAHSKILK